MDTVTLIVNLGSPRSTDPRDVREYLDEFLMDGRVIDVPRWLRAIIVRGIILRKRPERSAEAYSRIWTDEGSPLIVTSRKVVDKVRGLQQMPVYLSMRYGSPSIREVLMSIRADQPIVRTIQVLPMYPHYAMSSYETVVAKVRAEAEQILPGVRLLVRPAFYDDPEYIALLADSFRLYVGNAFDHLLLSYHGIPERHIRKCDVTRSHCLKREDCCQTASPAHAFCYRHQCYRTSELLIKALRLDPEKVSVSFQSRLGVDPWLKPYTDYEFRRLAEAGIRHLVVACPAFVTDCLETLEEIQMEGREIFLGAGGEKFSVIPCLNERPAWIELIAQWIGQKDKWHDADEVVHRGK